MNPARRNDEGLSWAEQHLFHRGWVGYEVNQEVLRLSSAAQPLFVSFQVLIRRCNQAEFLTTRQYMIPHAGSSKINVKVGVAPFTAQQTVLLHTRVQALPSARRVRWSMDIDPQEL